MHATNNDPIIDRPLTPYEHAAALSDRARQLSRQIGEAKRSGQPYESLIDERRRIEALLQEQTVVQHPKSLGAPSPAAFATSSTDVTAPCRAEPPATPISVRLFQPSDTDMWDAFVRAQGKASVYHLIGWRTVCEHTFGHECPYLLAEANGHIVGVLPLVRLKSRLFGDFLVSLPYFNYGGVLSTDEHTGQALLQAACDMAQGWGCTHLELRDVAARPSWPARTDKVAMWLNLPESSQALWQALGSKVRAQIKKSQTSGLSFHIGGMELLDDFYKVFATHMRDLGTPVYSKRFFANVLKAAPGNPVLVVGRDAGGQPVSVALLLRFGQRMEVPWASTLRRAHGANANMALYWRILTYACEQGCRQFDFGRSTVDAPTYRFKKQWGAMPVPLHWHYWLRDGGELPRLNPDNPKYRLAIGVWKQLPVWLTRLIGPPIVKNLP